MSNIAQKPKQPQQRVGHRPPWSSNLVGLFATFLCLAWAPVWAQVAFRVGEVESAPGASDVRLPVVASVAADEFPLEGWALIFRYDPSVLAEVTVENTREADFHVLDSSEFREPGTLFAKADYDAALPRQFVPPGTEVVVANLRFCVVDSVAPGEYPLELLESAERWSGHQLQAFYIVDDDKTSGSELEGGTLDVRGDAVGASCEPEIHTPPDPGEPGRVHFRLGSVTAAPGQSDLLLPIDLAVRADAFAVQEWSLVVAYDPEVLAGVAIENLPPAGLFHFFPQEDFSEPGHVGAHVRYQSSGDFLAPGTTQHVANLSFCVLPDAAPGDHSLAVIPRAARRPNGFPVASSYRAADLGFPDPTSQAGVVRIAGDRQPGTCEPDDRTFLLPEELEGGFRLLGSSATRGEEVRVPFLVHGNAPVRGFSFSVDFDEEILRATDIEEVFQRTDGARYDFWVYELNNRNETPGNGGVDEGFVAGAVVFSFTDRAVALSPNQDNETLALHFAVSPNAAAGSTTIGFVDGAPLPGSLPTANIVNLVSYSVEPDAEASAVVIDAVLKILDPVRFLRGDSNFDGRVNISDAVRTLRYLLLGDDPPECADAADADDNGKLEITDAIRTLAYLFLGGEPLPSPSGGLGIDGTADNLTCLR